MYPLVNLHQLRIFTCVAEQKSFAKGASMLRITQPAASIQIKNLEDTLGVKLLDRLGHVIRPTAEGDTVLAYAKKLFDLICSLETDLANLNGLTSGKLVVGACKIGSAQIVPRAIASFRKQYPAVEFTLRVAESDQVEKWVLENEVDLGLIIGDPLSSKIVKEAFYEEELVLVLPPGHALTNKRTVSPEEISKEIVLLPYTGRLGSIIGRIFSGTRLSVTQTVVLGHGEALKTAIGVGLGVSIMANSSIQRDAMSGTVVTRKIKSSHVSVPLNLIYHKEKHFSRLAVTFLEFLRKVTSQQALRIPPANRPSPLGSSPKT